MLGRTHFLAVHVAAVVIAMASGAAQASATAAEGRTASTSDWSGYERGPAHTSAQTNDAAITAANAGHLRAIWHFNPAKPTASGQPGPILDASPTVVGNRVYIGARTGVFSALDVATGHVVWRRQLDYGSNATCSAKGITGTASVLPDPVDGTLTVYAVGAHYLYALDAATGAQKWSRAIGPATASGEALYFNWASPTIQNGTIYLGLAANCERRLIRGGVVAIDQHTGAVRHTYYAVPAGTVGASVWSSEAVDATAVYVTTGNPDPHGTRLDDAYSIVRLSSSTLARQDKWTMSEGQADDLDFGSSPTLFQGTLGGVATLLVAACNKNGQLYAWRRDNLAAGPVWQRQVGAREALDTGSCLTSPVWGTGRFPRLFVAANQTTIDGVTVPGSIRSLSPDDGSTQWEKPLACLPLGTPTLNVTTHVLAVPLYGCANGVAPSVTLFDADDGTMLGSLPATSPVFAQPVFAAGLIFVASEHGGLTAYGP